MHIVQQLDERRWREFVENNPRGGIFHTPEMFQVFARTKGHHPTLWAIVGDGEQVLALLLPVQVTVLDGLLRHFTTRAVVYGSVLCAPGPAGAQALDLLLQAYNRAIERRVLFTEMRNLSDLSDLQPVLDHNEFAFEEHSDFIFDLDQAEETLWGKISRSARQRVRSARNKGMVIEAATSRQHLISAYRLLQDVYTRARVPLAGPTLFEAAFDILGPRGMFKIFLARLDGRLIGARFLLMFRGTILDWYAGVDRNFSSCSPSELLVWHALQWGREQGFHRFQFGGAGPLGRVYGVRDFKAKFGGQFVNYGRNVCTHAPVRLKVSRAAYQFVRAFL